MSDLTLSDALAERIRILAQAEKVSIEELLTVMVDRYTITERVKVAENPLKLPNTEEATEEHPVLSAYPLGSLEAIAIDNIDRMTLLGALAFPDRITGVGYSPDGKYLAIRLDKRIVLWDIHTAQEYVVLEYGAWVETFAFTPDGKALILSVGSMFSQATTGSTLHYWNIATRQEEFTWKPHTGFVNSIAVNPQNPEVVALISAERRFVEERPNSIRIFNVGVELWDGTDLITRFTDFRQFYREGYNKLNDRALAFGYDGKTLFVSMQTSEYSSGQVLAWEGLGSGDLYAISEPDECFMELTLDRQGNQLAISNAPAGKLSVRNLKTGTIVYTNEDTQKLPYRLEFDLTGSILVVGRNSKARDASKVDFVNLQTGETIRELTLSYIGAIAFSPDNTSFAIQTKKVLVWGITQ